MKYKTNDFVCCN